MKFREHLTESKKIREQSKEVNGYLSKIEDWAEDLLMGIEDNASATEFKRSEQDIEEMKKALRNVSIRVNKIIQAASKYMK